jgi:hypothetical protein
MVMHTKPISFTIGTEVDHDIPAVTDAEVRAKLRDLMAENKRLR